MASTLQPSQARWAASNARLQADGGSIFADVSNASTDRWRGAERRSCSIFAYEGGGAGKGGIGTLFINGEKVGQGRIEVTQCCAFSATEGADVGLSTGTPVTPDYTNPFRFNGKIEKVTIDLRDDKTTAADRDAIETAHGDSRLKRALSN